MKTQIYIEYNNQKLGDKEISEKIKSIWISSGNKIKDIFSVKVFIKPEENKIYYVINDDFTGDFSF